ncbi:flagellar motor protein MotB [Rubrivivax gelatinosus]|uniref:Histidine kinase n=1 Tax=Rubrivivax gelatinosus TaxID=28068 RepID=A0ABS1E2R8_RUBGE|nr:histidine kinase [Rubrivivax gelatinosus]
MPSKPEALAVKGAAHGDTIVRRASRKGHEGGHGGAWKVAFADFCLALLALFLVLWLLASRDKEKAEEALRASGAGLLADGAGAQPVGIGDKASGSLIDRNPVPWQSTAERRPQEPGEQTPLISKSRLDSPEDLRELQQVLAKLGEKAGLSNNLQSVITPAGLRILLHDTDRQGLFDVGSARPGARLQQLLRDLGPLFAQLDNQLLIIGHTDALPYAGGGVGAMSNWGLSSARAMSARTWLRAGGMPDRSVLQVVGMADSAPLQRDDPRAAVNRRIELLLLTTAQARAIEAMFGAPASRVPLTEGSDAAGGPAESESLVRQLLGRVGAGR